MDVQLVHAMAFLVKKQPCAQSTKNWVWNTVVQDDALKGDVLLKILALIILESNQASIALFI